MALFHAYGSVILFLVTLFFIIRRPKNISIGIIAMIGAIIAILLGFVKICDIRAIVGLIWDPTIAFVAIVVISLFLQEIGFFDWVALHTSFWARGSGFFLFFYFLILGALVSAFFTNDGTALILTPIVLANMRHLQMEEKMILPFVVACGFIADSTSLPLITSNLTNILTADYFHIGYASYAKIMLFPNFISFLASFGILYFFYRRSIPSTYAYENLPKPASAIKDKKIFCLAIILLFFLFILFFFNQIFHWPFTFLIVPCALILFICSYRKKTYKKVLRAVPWEILFFSLGMYIVIYGIKNSEAFVFIPELIKVLTQAPSILSVLGIGFFGGALSSIVNNLPALVLNILAIDQSSLTSMTKDFAIYANLIGCNIGSKMTPFGSLSTLLWLFVLQKQGMKISWGYVTCIGILFTIPTLFFSLLALWAILG